LEPETRLPIDPFKEEIKVFLSYNHEDHALCERLGKDRSLQGIRVIVDRSNLQLADPLKERLTELIRDSHATICIVSRRSLKSAWVCWEILRHRSELENGGKKLIPAFVDKSFLDDGFVNEVGALAQNEILNLIRLTTEHSARGEPTPHLDTRRNALMDLKSNLPFIVDKFRLMCVVSLMESEYVRTLNDIYAQLTCGGKPSSPIRSMDLKNLDIKARQMEIGNLLMAGRTKEAALCALDYVKDFMAFDLSRIGKALAICGKLNSIDTEIHDPIVKIQFRSGTVPEILDLIQYGSVAVT
jgi:hypothetical protein